MATTENQQGQVQPGTLNVMLEKARKANWAFPRTLWADRSGQPFVNIRVVAPFTTITQRDSKFNLALFMPNSMKIGYNSVWEELDLGQINNLLSQGLAGKIESEKSLQEQLFGAAAAGSIGKVSQYTGINADASAQIAARIAVNPHSTLLFKTMQFREFLLIWQLFPKSAEDCREIGEIIFQLKYAMHPGAQNLSGTARPATQSNFFGLPEQFILSFYAPNIKSLVKTHPCALLGCDVEYNGMGYPTYFWNDRPACINLVLHFKESAILTKEDISRGW